MSRGMSWAILREYRRAGCRTDEDVLELAATRGHTALSEAIAALGPLEARPRGTGMEPAAPLDLNHSKWVSQAHELLDVVLDSAAEDREEWRSTFHELEQLVQSNLDKIPLWSNSNPQVWKVGPWNRRGGKNELCRPSFHRQLDDIIDDQLMVVQNGGYQQSDDREMKDLRSSISFTTPDEINNVGVWAPGAGRYSAVSEGSGRENSTAMVVLGGTPPGRNTCALIRSLINDRSKLIVVAQSGPLAPGNFERLLRASMPDVEKKLRVMDAGASLADAVTAAERNRHYRPSQALQVFCDPQQARNFGQEVQDGSLGFDPTVIQVSPIQVPKDDPGEITTAVKSDDLQAMHRLLDPHIFSSQEGITDYRSALLGESRALHEFLTDISKSRSGALKILSSVVSKNWELLRGRGLDLSELKYLGAGNNGAAWQIGDGRVLKVTTDDAEAHVASHLRGKRFKHIFTIYDVWAFPDQVRGHHIYGLITEAGLKKPSENERRDFDWMVETQLQEAYGEEDERGWREAAEDLWTGDLRKVLQGYMANPQFPPEDKKRCLHLVKMFDLPGICADMKRVGYQADLHSGNFMVRPDGTYVVIDIGTGGDQESQKAPFLNGEGTDVMEVPVLGNAGLNEFGSVSPGSGSPGPPTMRGSNSSAWSAGMLALKRPERHVPEDENEDERSIAMDWGPGRVSGASF